MQLPAPKLEPLRSVGTAGAPAGRHPQVQVTVARKWTTAEGIAAFELAPVAGELPSFQPGAHVDVLDHVPAGLTKHLGLSPTQTTDQLRKITENYLTTSHTYICGPGPMIEAARALATESGWPEEAVHFEYFKNESAQDDTSTFEVLLARRNETLVVNAGVSLLESLRSAGVDMPSSCEQGVCGTCMVTVLDGERDHQDVYFSDLRDAHAILIYLAGKYDPAATWYPTHDPQLLGEHARITRPCAGGPNVSGACRASSRCPASFPSRHCRHE